MAGANLRLAEQQRRIVPAAIERVGDLRRDARHLGFVLAQPADDAREIGDQPRPVELEVIGGDGEVGAVLLQQVQQPMAKLQIAVARALGLPQSLDERLVADAVQLAGDGFDADVGAHVCLPQFAAAALAPRRLCK